MTPHDKIHRRHVALSFHFERESIAAKIVNYLSIDGNINPAGVLNKNWSHNDVWPNLKPILFRPGDVMECLNNDSLAF